MYQTYLHTINHNRYLKVNYSNPYKYSKLDSIKLVVKFDLETVTKLNILYIYFLFKNFVSKNGLFILLNKKTKKIIGMKFIFQHNLMFKLLFFIKNTFLNQPEVSNLIQVTAFDKNQNYTLYIPKTLNYYLEKNITNPYYKAILMQFDMTFHLVFNNNTDFFDHMFYLNFFGFSFFLN